MTYVDGLVFAVPTANKDAFKAHAEGFGTFFIENGAIRLIDCWGDDVPDGKLTDFRKAVQATEDETVVFSWIEWPDKATRDAAFAKMYSAEGQSDPRLDPVNNPMPLDMKRMIMGGFAPLVDLKK